MPWTLKVWSNHSSITDLLYFMVMVQVIYDPAVFLTDAEYQTKFKTSKRVQSLIEIPRIYILGVTDTTGIDQAKYNEAIHQDLLKLDQPVYTQSNIP